MSSKKIIEVAAAILKKDGKFLICRRGEGGSCAHLWEFPGGKREPGETFSDCLVRECREELGIEIEVVQKYDAFCYSYPDRDIYFEFYLAEWKSGELSTFVHEQILWVFPEELEQYEFCPADVALVERLAQETEK